MAVSPDVQAAISERYLALSSAILNGDHRSESQILAPRFHDARTNRIPSFEYDQLTVIVSKIAASGNVLEVHATYYGAHGRKIKTVDHWMMIDGQYRLLDRN